MGALADLFSLDWQLRSSYIFTCTVFEPVAGIAYWHSGGLVIERLRVRIPAGAAGEFRSPQLTLCVVTLIRCPFHPNVTAVARKRPRHSAKVQVAGYT